LKIGVDLPPLKKTNYEATPGELYKGITSTGEVFEGESKLVMEKDPDFVIFCKKMYKSFPGFGAGAKYPEGHYEAVSFLGWRLSAAEFKAAVKGTAILGGIGAIIALVILVFVGLNIDLGFTSVGLGLFSDMLGDFALVIVMAGAVVLFGIIGAIVYTIYTTPISMADDERTRALTYVPEMIGYLIMSMKLVPNLEKAIEFSAKHGKGKVADEFNKVIWDFQNGFYSSISEGLDAMALRWAKYSTELKESLMKIRASVMEPSESKRYSILDKTMIDVLESVKDKMGDYARSLNQPSVMLFYIGVLLPLLLVIILPIGSAFSNLPFATTPILVGIYCIMIPFMAFSFAKGVVRKRPPTYEPPVITDNFAGLPPKWSMKLGKGMIDARLAVIGILVLGIVLSFVLSFEGLPPKHLFPQEDGEFMIPIQLIPADPQIDEVYKEFEGGKNYFEKIVLDLYAFQVGEGFGGGLKEGVRYKQLVKEGTSPAAAEIQVVKEKLDFVSKTARNDPTKYIFWAGLILTIVGAACFLLYHRNIYKLKAQEQIVQMEDEFKESMYMIASRMGENKPVESALKQTNAYLPNLLVSKRIFGKTIENIELMGLPLESAIFDPMYGSMKGIPSKILTTAMRLLVDSVNLGVEVASRTLMSLSLQLDNMDKVNKSLKDMVSDVTTTMQTMAIFIAPMVLGITTALQKVVLNTLGSVVSSPQLDSTGSVGDITGGAGSQILQTAGLSPGGMGDINSIFSVSIDAFRSFATPLEYMLIIGTYVVMIVVILTYFTVKVKEDNDLVFKITLAKQLPIAMAVYLCTTIAANLMVGGLMSR